MARLRPACRSREFRHSKNGSHVSQTHKTASTPIATSALVRLRYSTGIVVVANNIPLMDT